MGFIAKTFFAPEFHLILLLRHQETLHIVKQVKMKKLSQMVKIGKKQYIVDLENPTYIVDNKRFYYVDIESGSLYSFKEHENIINADDLDVIVGNKIIRELTAGVMDNKKALILYAVAGIFMGVLLGMVIMNFVMQEKIEELYDAMLNRNDTIVPFAKTMLKMWRK